MAEENKPDAENQPSDEKSEESSQPLQKPSTGGDEKPAKQTSGQPPAGGDKPEAKSGAGGKPPPKPGEKPAVKPPPKKKAPPTMETSPWEGPLVDALKERFGEQIKEFATYREQPFLIAELDSVVPIIEYLKLEQDFDYLVDVTAVDYPKKEKRFEVIWILYSFARNERIRVKALAGEEDSPKTAVSLHLAADWLEREVFDMFGIKFEGHPTMKRILLPEEWQGHPLRKDYSIIQQDKDWVRENLQIESAQ